DKIASFLWRLEEIREFVESTYLPDIVTVAQAYPDYFEIGQGPGNFMSFGGFPDGKGGFAFPRGVVMGGRRLPLDFGEITESAGYTWLRQAGEMKEPDPGRREAYSWVEAPRYSGEPMEVGPLARAVVSGGECRSSAMDRVVARSREAQIIAGLMFEWLDQLEPGKPSYLPPGEAVNCRALGALEVPRGGLLHGIGVEGDRIVDYKIITPSEWNFSPRDDSGRLGPVEQSLLGTPVEDAGAPIEVGRVARSYDPCMYCATHVLTAARVRTGDEPY
ncbi:MAG: nickel-dependent hydrogenase large subunit, partial [Syntrophomonadaceae bacterium]|nr:nickel-dependent hydrogenase large subunit [Syntrophomonadaceae bacterium]